MRKLDGIRLVLADLDGTLLNDQKELDTEITKVLKQKHLEITFVTGRNRHIVSDYVDTCGIKLPYIINNGAHIIQNDYCLYQRCIVSSEFMQAYHILMKHRISFLAYSEQSIYCQGESYALQHFIQRLVGKCAIVYNRLPKENCIFKITIVHDNPLKMHSIMKEINSSCPSSNLVRSEGNIYTLTHRDATKGNAIIQLLELLKIKKSQVIAFGDNFNDISMFEVINNSVAMGNATAFVKEHAAYVTDSNNANGVSKFLLRYVNHSL